MLYSDEASDAHKINSAHNNTDTLITRLVNPITESYEVGFYAKSYSYVWINENDTLPFYLRVTEYIRDSSVSIRFVNRHPIPFSQVLNQFQECLPVIKQDFKMSKCKWISLESPIYYPDMSNTLSEEYRVKFGWKNISYSRLNMFLQNSSINKDMTKLLAAINLKTTGYFIEKFQLVNKRHLEFEHPQLDTSNYREYVLHGMGMSIRVQPK